MFVSSSVGRHLPAGWFYAAGKHLPVKMWAFSTCYASSIDREFRVRKPTYFIISTLWSKWEAGPTRNRVWRHRAFHGNDASRRSPPGQPVGRTEGPTEIIRATSNDL